MNAPTPAREEDQAAAAPGAPRGRGGPRRIGLWGAPGCGKTTFLAALRIAVEDGAHRVRLTGLNDNSTAFLADATQRLKVDHRFLPATSTLPPNLAWELLGMRREWTRRRFAGLPFRWPDDVPYTVRLDVLDAPGGMYGGRRAEQSAPGPSRVRFSSAAEPQAEEAAAGGAPVSDEARLVEHLASCDGLLFLFDPTREREMNDAYDYFQRTVLEISQRAARSRTDHQLPQHLAVCVTKFDHPEVYEKAVKHGYATPPPDIFGMPRVTETQALPFLKELYRGTHTHETVDALLNSITTHFHERRTGYFVTSAVGFYRDPRERRFMPEDYLNVIAHQDADGETGDLIRGDVCPINVLEPVLWLLDRVGAR
ncbi:hypothetical protein [Actinomadura sp. GTD37]|uniref:hypothetical protein n=1 Tax=Actinomadura sp. GTD37 TaxID=1778030 RepID=UPI0035BEFE35